MKFVITSENFDSFKSTLEKLPVKLIPKKLSKALGNKLVGQTKERFGKAIDVNGKRFAKLSERYKKRVKIGSILLRSRDLRQAVMEASTDYEAIVANNLVYAAAINWGYEKRNLPARQFLGPSDNDSKTVQEVFNGFVKKALKNGQY